MLHLFGRSLINKTSLISHYCVSSVSVKNTGDNNTASSESLADIPQALSAKFPRHSDTIEKLFVAHPHLQQSKIGLWHTFFTTLEQFGFDVIDCINILTKEPQVLSISNRALLSIVSRWNDCPVNNDFMKLLLINRPELFFLPPVNVEKRVPCLQQFVSNQKSLTLLLLQCPNVLTEQWESVQAKIDYLNDVMIVEKSDIVSSCALNKSLEHIKLRHTLLEKCGLYVRPSQHEHKRIKNEKSSFRNPPLKRIVDNEDISFAKKICKISAEEYDVYKTMFTEEMLSDAEYNSGSDSDSD